MTEMNRRHVLRYGAVGALAATAAAVGVQTLTASGSRAEDLEEVQEEYKGRQLLISQSRLGDGTRELTILIDGQPLHVMPNADGTYTSIVNHYQSFTTGRDLARAAVDDLGDARLERHLHHN